MLQLRDPALGVAADGRQRVEFVIETGAHEAASADRGRRFVHQRPLHHLHHFRHRLQPRPEAPQQLAVASFELPAHLLQRPQGLLDGGQVPRRRTPGGDAAGQALQVLDAAKSLPEPSPQFRPVEQFLHRVVAAPNPKFVEQGIKDPLAQLPGSHGGAGGLHHPEQRAVPAAAEAAHQLQVALGILVEHEELGSAVGLQGRQHLDRPGRAVFEVGQDGAGGADPQRPLVLRTLVDAGAVQLLDSGPGEPGVGPRGAVHAGVVVAQAGNGAGMGLRDQQLARLDPSELVGEGGVAAHLGEAEFAGGDVGEGQAVLVAGGDDRHQEVVDLGLETLPLREGAGADDLDDLAPDHALGELGILGLLAHRHLEAGGQELADVRGGGVMGHAAKGHRLAVVAIAAGEGDVEYLGRPFRVLEEHLVEVAEPEKQDGVLVPFLDLQVLVHHGRGACPLHHAPPGAPS